MTVDALDAARAAIATNNFEAAHQILVVLLTANSDDVESQFLMAELEFRRRNLSAAIDRFQTLLVAHPDVLRARLDYAEVLFQDGQDERSEYNFRLALAADLPDAVRNNVMSRLHAIQTRRIYQVHLELAMAPNTNINYGNGLTQITLFGLPFTPNLDQKAKSGIGIMASAAGEIRFPITETFSWRANGILASTEYPDGGGAYNDNIARFQTGPQWTEGNWIVSALGVATQRWFGNRPFYHGAGIQVETVYGGLDRWRLEADVEDLLLAFNTQKFENGTYLTLNFYPVFYLSPSSFLRPILGIVRQDVNDPAYSNTGVRAGLGFHKEYGFGYSVYLQAEGYLSLYDAINLGFGTTRQDETLRLQASVYRRDWIVFGFNPVLSVIYTKNYSNQGIYSYSRNQLQIGFTKDF